MTPDELSDRLVTFAARVGLYVDSLPDTRLARHVASQLVRSATSPAPNYEEARAAESREDFIHKVSISLKELRESRVWLRILLRAGLVPHDPTDELRNECDQLCSILGQSVNTARRNLRVERKPPSTGLE